jgi:hypothetical protein
MLYFKKSFKRKINFKGGTFIVSQDGIRKTLEIVRKDNDYVVYRYTRREGARYRKDNLKMVVGVFKKANVERYEL